MNTATIIGTICFIIIAIGVIIAAYSSKMQKN